jgi:serine/threonine-protein kinase
VIEMAAPQKSTLIGQPIGRYRVTRQLGQGDTGDVYEVVQDSIGYRAVVKVLPAQLADDPNNQQFVSRFLDEARSVNFINHPGIVRIFDLGELTDHSLFIMMEYLDGQTLTERLRAAPSGRLALSDALRITRQIAAVMMYVHAKGVLHRDLNPSNVILVADSEAPAGERIKLIDFGLAKFLDSPERRTTFGLALGTPTYMAPEQCLGIDKLEGRADVYSLGCILYEMLSGRTPFSGSPQAVMKGHVHTPPPPIRDLVPGLPDVVQKLVDDLLGKTIVQRPDMGQVEACIRKIEADLQKASTPGQPPARSGRSSMLLSGLAAGIMLVSLLDFLAFRMARPRLEHALCPPPPARAPVVCPACPSPPAAQQNPADEPAGAGEKTGEADSKAAAEHHKAANHKAKAHAAPGLTSPVF